MGFSFLAPFFLGGAALLALPYFIHKIRRPEREPLRFSSTLLIPDTPREVIERRRLQHLLLMLLRMLVLLLLALAFSRPYWKALAAFGGPEGPARHLVLLDTSYSMGVNGAFEEAKAKAIKTVDGIADGDDVGVLLFAERSVLASPLGRVGGDVDAKAAAKDALRSATLTNEGTSYVDALRRAQGLLATEDGEETQDERRRLIVHVVSDFRRSGMPDRQSGWKLPAAYTLDLAPVGGDTPLENAGITDVVVRKQADGSVRVVGKIKNWSESGTRETRVRLFLGGEEREAKTLSIDGGNARQAAFRVEVKGDTPLEGYLTLDDDALALDNTRYFTWHPPRKKQVYIFADSRGDVRWPSRLFVTQAIQSDPETPFTIVEGPSSEVEQRLLAASVPPEAVIVCDAAALTVAGAAALRGYIDGGGQCLFIVSDPKPLDAINQGLLSGTGLAIGGALYATPVEERFELLSWVDLNHPVFVPFRGARFNDFSSLRFYDRFQMSADDAKEGNTVFARFEEGSPAMAEAFIGAGRLIVWPFDVTLAWTNLPKHSRFVPLLYETLAYLVGLHSETTERPVGIRLTAGDLPANAESVSIVQFPQGEPAPITVDLEAELPRLDAPGFYRAKPQGGETWTVVNAVNVAANEGDLAALNPAEFELKLSSAPALEAAPPGDASAEAEMEDIINREEYGRSFLAILCLCLLVEGWYMSALKR